ncbi:TPA: hypothetical protein EYP38_03660 [Candidatus Micrarchaeota archaeon]|nr:hypothetical protein [Candidatus Micrarchaeota archaeon]
MAARHNPTCEQFTKALLRLADMGYMAEVASFFRMAEGPDRYHLEQVLNTRIGSQGQSSYVKLLDLRGEEGISKTLAEKLDFSISQIEKKLAAGKAEWPAPRVCDVVDVFSRKACSLYGILSRSSSIWRLRMPRPWARGWRC